MRKRKTVPKGRTLMTNDKYLPGAYTGSKKKRGAIVFDSNDNDELAVVPMSSKPGSNRTRLKNYQDGKSYFKHYIETVDNEGKPIKINEKFSENHKNMDVSKKDLSIIEDTLFNTCKQHQKNRKKYSEYKKSPR